MHHWRLVSVVSAALVLFVMLLIPLPFQSGDVRNGSMVDYDEISYSFPLHRLIQESEWRWDHNVYQSRVEEDPWLDPERRPIHEPMEVPWWNTTETSVPSPSGRNLLIAQFVGSVDPTNPRRRKHNASQQQRVLANIADVTSRPNRAYARQWGRNFVRFQLWDDFTLAMALFLKVIRDRQEEEPASLQHDDECIVPYDVIALLLPGAVIMDLDYDLLELIPKEKLLAVAGGNSARPRTNPDDALTHPHGIVLLNLQHDRANQWIDRWWDEIERSYFQHFSDRLANSSEDTIPRLIQFTESMLWDGEDITSLVFSLEETDLGFVLEVPYSIRDMETHPASDASSNAFCVKSFAPATPEDGRLRNTNAETTAVQLLTNPQSTLTTLQTTADAVCYRYYPKCELL
jgi:hypothetical protein